MGRPLCLVTGSCGFMGTHMVEILKEAGFPVRATDLASAHERDDRILGHFPSVLDALDVPFVAADLTDKASLEKAVEGVGYVFHLGAVFNYTAPWALLEAVNVAGTRNLLELLQEQNSFKKIVYWGAGGIYDIETASLPITEESPIRPTNNYLESKWQAEQVVRDFCEKHDMAYSIVRGTTVYGPRAAYGSGPLLMQAATQPVAVAPRNWTFRIPFVHAVDMCRAALHAAEHSSMDGQDYIVNDDSQMTTVDFFAFTASLTGHPFVKAPSVPIGVVKTALMPLARALQWTSTNITHRPPPIEADTIKYLGVDFVYSNHKIKSSGFQFQYPDARRGIADTVVWYQRNGWI
ncbi:MAG: NAD-dependent epimerase/dehydratase family protein [Deltaproteobacteria bacterium]|nr:NAD-dependent epimerase/dehydratase family protein [Deltaproteobacteria bacterium]